MAKFNAAKMQGAQDKKFQDAYNQLIDLLDTGYIVEKTIDGKRLRIVINNDEGIAFYDGKVYRGGIDLIGNELALLTDTIADPDYKEKFARFVSSAGNAGLYLYNLYSDATIPFLSFKEAWSTVDPGVETRIGAYITYNDDSRIIFLDDETQLWSPSATTYSGNRITVSDTGIGVFALPIYANNAAAIAGGLSAGHLYRTGADPDVVCVVH